MVAVVDIGTLIVRTPGVCGGTPRIANTRITVRNIINWLRSGWSPEYILSQYEHLSLAQVYAAMSYYYANRAEMDTAFVNEEAEEERIEREHLVKQSL